MFNLEDLVFKIKESNPIENIVSEYVSLKRSGSSLKGLCPFHSEKTPSFIVNSTKGFYHCFGCSKSGDVISFIMEIEHVDFNDAIEILAKKSGIDLSQYKRSGERGVTSTIYEANEIAMNHYKKSLMDNSQARDYLKQRMLDLPEIETFKLGFSDSSNSLINHLKEKRFKYDDFVKAGLIHKDQYGNMRDVFFNRIMFPIFSNSGNVIGFGGRVLKDDNPKYLNTQETPVFKKGNFLYGLHLSRQAVSQKNSMILVEGYMDFISLFRAGVRNAAAQLGTACTAEQAKIIKKACEKVILMYDTDEAGRNATMRSIPILLKEGLIVSVFSDKTVKDPDELVKKLGDKIDFAHIESGRKDFIWFAEEYFKEKEEDEMLSKKHFVNFVIDAVKNIEDDVTRNLYTKGVVERLRISEKFLKPGVKSEQSVKEEKDAEKPNIYHEIIAIMLSDRGLCKKLCFEVEETDFLDLPLKGTFISICNSLDTRDENIDLFIKNDKIKYLKDYIIKRMTYYLEHKPDEKKINEILGIVKEKRILKRIEEIDIKIKNASDEEEKDRLMHMRVLMVKKIKGGR
ncbi:MAG: DNA primase [bacterium]